MAKRKNLHRVNSEKLNVSGGKVKRSKTELRRTVHVIKNTLNKNLKYKWKPKIK